MCSYDDRVRPLPAVPGCLRPSVTAACSSRSPRRGEPAASRWWGVSAPAEAYGVVRGVWGNDVALSGPANATAPDPEGVRSLWHTVARPARGDGRAEVESDHAGAAFFAAEGLPRNPHGGDLAGVIERRAPALGPEAPAWGAPSRFASHAAALQVRPRRGGAHTSWRRRRCAASSPRSRWAASHAPRAARARGARAARHPHPRRARRAALASDRGALRPPGAAGTRPEPRPRPPRAAPAIRAGGRAPACRRRRRASSLDGRSAC